MPRRFVAVAGTGKTAVAQVYCCCCTTLLASLLWLRVEESLCRRAVLVFFESKVVFRAPSGHFCLPHSHCLHASFLWWRNKHTTTQAHKQTTWTT